MISGKRLYSVIRSHGLSLHLLSYKQIIALIESENLDQLIWNLSNTEYAKFLKAEEDLLSNNSEIERKINKVMYDRLFHIISLFDNRMAELVRAYLSKYDLEILRKIIYAKISQKKMLEQEAPLREFLPGTTGLLNVIETKQMSTHPVFRPIINALEDWQKSGVEDIALLDVLLESSYAKMLTQKLKSRFIEKKVKEIFYSYIQERLLLVGLRALYSGNNEKILILRKFIGLGAYNVLSTAGDFEIALRNLSTTSKYSKLAKKILDVHADIKEPFIWEFVHFGDLLERTAFAARRNFIGSAFLIWYVFRTEWEAQALRTIIIGKKEGISTEILRKIFFVASDLSKYEDSH